MIISKYNWFSLVDNQVYIFNPLSGSICKINYDLYQALISKDLSTMDCSLQATLYNLHILEDENFDEFQNRIKLNEDKLKKSLAFFLCLTNECNLKCPYCFETERINLRKESLTTARWSFLKRYMINYCKNKNITNIAICIFGGEPLLNLDQLISILNDYELEQAGLSVDFSMISNGVLLTPKISSSIEKLSSCQITFDGTKHMHNQLRRSDEITNSFDIVYRNALNYAKLNPKKLDIRINVAYLSEDYFDLLNKISQDYATLQIRSLSFSPIYDFDKPNAEDLQEIIKINELICSLTLKANEFNLPSNIEIGRSLCLYDGEFPGAIDEQLNIYQCPGELYKRSYGHINSSGKIIEKTCPVKISKSCFRECIFGPMCYGGCKVLDVGSVRCKNRDLLIKILDRRILTQAKIIEMRKRA